MRIAVTFTSIYVADGEFVRTEALDVAAPVSGADDDGVEQWADEELFPHTGEGITEGDAGYFAQVLSCDAQPELVGAEFEWGT